MSAPCMVCITGTDTDVGKTVVTAGLLLAAASCGRRAAAVKPVQTGCAPLPGGGLSAPDAEVWAEACPAARVHTLEAFEPSCSPHLAARLSGRSVDAASLARRTAVLAAEADITVVEGAGGLLAPLNDRECVADVFTLLGAPVILVAANRLGAINHALLSLEALRARGLALARLVLTTPQPLWVEDSPVEEDNPAVIARLSGTPGPVRLPFLPGLRARDAGERRTAWDEAARRLTPLAKTLLGLSRI